MVSVSFKGTIGDLVISFFFNIREGQVQDLIVNSSLKMIYISM